MNDKRDIEKFVREFFKTVASGSWSGFRHAVARKLGIIPPIDPKHPLRIVHPPREWSVPQEYIEAYKKYRR